MSINIWQGRLKKVLLSHVETLGIDYACVQEAVAFDGKSMGIITPHQDVGAAMGLDNEFFSPLITTTFGSKKMSFGNATYSRSTFEETETIFTRGEYNAEHNFDLDDYNVRAFQHCRITLNNKSLHLINHHGHHIDQHKLGDEETLRQTKLISDYVRKLDGAVIVCGDFNLAPESESIKILEKDLRNLSVEAGLKTTRSLLTNKKEVCDYIFVNEQVEVHAFNMDTTIISDHNALILDFDLK